MREEKIYRGNENDAELYILPECMTNITVFRDITQLCCHAANCNRGCRL